MRNLALELEEGLLSLMKHPALELEGLLSFSGRARNLAPELEEGLLSLMKHLVLEVEGPGAYGYVVGVEVYLGGVKGGADDIFKSVCKLRLCLGSFCLYAPRGYSYELGLGISLLSK